MHNYQKRIPLGNDKFAFEQTNDAREAALPYLRRIKRNWRPPANYYHFRRGGHVAAIRCHQSNEWFAKLDMRRFFEQVSRNRVIKRLKAIGFSFDDARYFADLSTVDVRMDGKFVLPFGFIQSPILAALDMGGSEFGRALKRIKTSDIVVSVYVDDILVSGVNEGIVNESIDELRSAAAETNYLINEEKSCLAQRSITAFNIDLVPGEIAVNDQRLDEFAIDIMQSGASLRSEAILTYIYTVNPQQGNTTKNDLARHFSAKNN